MTTERIAVSMAKIDFTYLNYIRQGALYSGKSVSLLPEIGDILKAIIFQSLWDISGDWESCGRDILVRFHSEKRKDAKALKELPKTKDKLILYLEKYETNGILRGVMKSAKEAGPPELFMMEKDFEKFRQETGGMQDNSLTNYILTIKEDEQIMMRVLKEAFHLFSDRNFSYSEIIRFLLRYYFIYSEGQDYNNKVRIKRGMMISSFYIYGLYGYNPIESLLLSHALSGFLGLEVDKEKMDMFKKIYYDKTLFDIYIGEIKKIIDEKDIKRKKIHAEMKEDPLFDDIIENSLLNGKYKSIASGFSFHPSFIGYTLLKMEWSFSEHTLPLLVTFLYAKYISLWNHNFLSALDLFEEKFKGIFDLSKNYNENEGSLRRI